MERRSKGYSAFKMRSPVKLTDAEKRANLLKAVPDKDAFDKLTPKQQVAFTKVGIAAGFPTKKK